MFIRKTLEEKKGFINDNRINYNVTNPKYKERYSKNII